ncbi:MAG TPA: hypothetical protein VE224_10840 [Pseudolabrys sp.]|nr:hypothetical protein [Pseudolabrys sp.]
MPRQADAPHTDDTVAAIERVLRAERDGVEALRRGEDQAQRVRAAARAEAAAIARRADRCIARLHGAYLQKIDNEIRALDSARAGEGGGAAAYDRVRLTAAAERIATRLTGAS